MKWDDIDQQVCSVARALSVLGERWTLLIIRDAFRGTRRFDDFQNHVLMGYCVKQYMRSNRAAFIRSEESR